MPLFETKISPDEKALMELAQKIWAFTVAQNKTPEIILSTAGPINLLRKTLEKNRPAHLSPSLVFLPKILSVDQWLKQTPALVSFPPVKTLLQRWEMVYAQLAQFPMIQTKFGALGEAGKWALVKAIVQACDFLTKAHVRFSIPLGSDMSGLYQQAQEAFEKAIEQAYPQMKHGLIAAEGELILAFWQHLSSTEDPFVREMLGYQLRTAELDKGGLSIPLVWIEMALPSSSLQHVQTTYLQARAQQVGVLYCSMAWETVALWPEALTGSIEAWSPEVNQQVAHNRDARADQQWRLLALPSFEKMAWGALTVLQGHIQAGRHHLALIAQDRLVARRIRALLDRLGPQINVIDRTGWKLSTTAAASALRSYLELMQDPSGPNTSILLGFLKNPMLDLAAWMGALQIPFQGDVEQFSWWVERTILSHVGASDWSDWLHLFAPEQVDDVLDEVQIQFQAQAQQLMRALWQSATLWQDRLQSSQAWVSLLEKDLADLGMLTLLENDSAGLSVLQALQELAGIQALPMRFSAWVQLFDMWLEQSAFVQNQPMREINISFITLSSLRLHPYDAVVMVGCDDRQLPTPQNDGSIFSKGLMAALDERLPHQEYIQQARDLSQLLASHTYVDFLWQEYQQAGEKNRPSAWLSRLQIGSGPLKKDHIVLPLAQTQHMHQPQAIAMVRHPELLPGQISPSAYQTLRSCPYRFFVTYILQLRAPKALQELSEFGVIGTLLHDVLKKFYRLYAKQHEFADADAARDWMCDTLWLVSQQSWQPFIQQNGHLLFERQQWLEQIPAWVDWQLQQEEQGWNFVEAEKNLSYTLELAKGVSLMIKGRVDRIDEHPSYGYRIWDYKFKNLKKIAQSKKNLWDDPQLLIYAKGLERERRIRVQDVGWLTIKDPENKERSVMLEVHAEVLQVLDQQMTGLLNQVWDGQPLPANGPSQVCQYCEARGICRKGMWD